MANITDAGAIPVAKQDEIKEVLVLIGPQLVPDVYPTEDVVGPGGETTQTPKTTLSNPEAVLVFEHVTRKFWQDQIRANEAEKAAKTAREAALSANETDPWE